MTGSGWKATAYILLSAVGLVGTWSYNIASFSEDRNYLGDWLRSGPSVSSLTVDVLVTAVAAAVFIVFEGRRLRMRHTWVYIVLIPVVALAFALPLFLAMRERSLRTQPPETISSRIESEQ